MVVGQAAFTAALASGFGHGIESQWCFVARDGVAAGVMGVGWMSAVKGRRSMLNGLGTLLYVPVLLPGWPDALGDRIGDLGEQFAEVRVVGSRRLPDLRQVTNGTLEARPIIEEVVDDLRVALANDDPKTPTSIMINCPWWIAVGLGQAFGSHAANPTRNLRFLHRPAGTDPIEFGFTHTEALDAARPTAVTGSHLTESAHPVATGAVVQMTATKIDDARIGPKIQAKSGNTQPVSDMLSCGIELGLVLERLEAGRNDPLQIHAAMPQLTALALGYFLAPRSCTDHRIRKFEFMQFRPGMPTPLKVTFE